MIRIVWCCVVAMAVAACADNRVQECFADGELYYCPADKQCGGLQRLCVDPGGCGNGLTESGEECDDGNVVAGDGCSPECKIEVCGNGRMDPGETCDDGNKVDGDGCTNDCASTNTCGNGLTDKAVGEECDDGNTTAGDGCGPSCRFEHCGNHITDPGEDCDDGNTTPGDGCSATCKFEGCGNGRLDPGEYCDDGNRIDNDTCNKDCTSDNRCGNHIVDANVGEVCDEGGVETPDCTADCRSQRQCGDGIVDRAAGEECDDGVTKNGDDKDCRADCIINRCGDGYANTNGALHHEDCDGAPPADRHDGAATPTETAACNADCTTAVCNDQKINRTAGEQCDDGPALNADDHDCTAGCKVNTCGDGLANTIGPAHLEACDDGNRVDGDDCTNQCSLPHCGDGILEGLEACDDGNRTNDDGCSSTCRFETCGDGIRNGAEECDRADPALAIGTCNLDCTLSRCGDHKINRDAGEECDDGTGNNADDHDCTAACKVNTCGDGLANSIGPKRVEECDDGNRVDGDSCTNQCKLPLCGDGILELLEQCDDGNRNNDDGCSATCRFETCGDGIRNGTEACDRADPALAIGTCNLDCTLSRCGDHKINRDAGEQCDDGDGNNANDRDCTAACQVNTCGDGLTDSVGPAHVEQCDDHNRIDGDTCTNQCTLPTCGDGILEGIEQCDDGNRASNDGCSSSCRFETCGDAIVNNGEACDYALTPETCNLDCTTSSCGDGKLNPHAAPAEECDDGHTVDGDGCSATCQLEHCGNGVIDPFEDCDGANPGTFPCSDRCRFQVCGNGILDPGEECDLAGDNSNTGACLTGCTVAVCGDGKVRAGVEQCDDGAANGDDADCTSACRTNVCGDGKLDTTGAQIEDCDDGPNNTEDATCPYNTSCGPRCSTSCHVLALTVPACGDGIIQGPDEVCDDHNTDACGSCSAACSQVTSQRAVGFIIPVAGNQTQDGDSFKLDDGLHVPLTFTFALQPIPLQGGAHLTAEVGEIDFFGTETLAQMAQMIRDAIQQAHDAGVLDLHVDEIDAVSLRIGHDRPTSLGNLPITEHVQAVTFFVVGMVGGAGGDCAAGVGCRTSDDCASGSCTGGLCDGP
jgi:cysteine-rich repeat protein